MSLSEEDRSNLIDEYTSDWYLLLDLGMSVDFANSLIIKFEEDEEYEECAALVNAINIYKARLEDEYRVKIKNKRNENN